MCVLFRDCSSVVEWTDYSRSGHCCNICSCYNSRHHLYTQTQILAVSTDLKHIGKIFQQSIYACLCTHVCRYACIYLCRPTCLQLLPTYGSRTTHRPTCKEHVKIICHSVFIFHGCFLWGPYFLISVGFLLENMLFIVDVLLSPAFINSC